VVAGDDVVGAVSAGSVADGGVNGWAGLQLKLRRNRVGDGMTGAGDDAGSNSAGTETKRVS
jgi:hypothetical protein